MWIEVGEVARVGESGRESGDGKVRLPWPCEGLLICGFTLVAVVKVQVMLLQARHGDSHISGQPYRITVFAEVVFPSELQHTACKLQGTGRCSYETS